MDITSFWVGVGITLGAILVACGVVVIFILLKRVKHLESDFKWSNDRFNNLDEVDDSISKDIEDINTKIFNQSLKMDEMITQSENAIYSRIDSNYDKLKARLDILDIKTKGINPNLNSSLD